MSELRGMYDQPGVPDVQSGVVLGADGPPDFPARREPQPVASRERMIEVLGGSELATATVDHLLAAGVFREAPTREQVEQAVTDKLIVSDALVAPGYSARIEADADDIAEAVAPAVLELINGGVAAVPSDR